MPSWLLQFLIGELSRYLTPEVVARLEGQAKQAVCCELARVAKTSGSSIEYEIVQKVADALGVDLSKCPA